METGQKIGNVLIFVGFILLVGNKTGWWPTIPYAGYITMLVGFGIAKLSKE